MQTVERWQADLSLEFVLREPLYQTGTQTSATGRAAAAALQEALDLAIGQGALAERLWRALGFDEPEPNARPTLRVRSVGPTL